ncbi:MAG: SDR family NAD(P)-dependent oxidoreductase [Propionibacteriaceae bacterium]
MQPPRAIVTGASRGIGAAIARALASDFAIDVCYHHEKELAENVAQSICASGSWARSVALDVTDAHAIERYASDLEDNHVEVAVVVNNAAIAQDSLLLQTSLDSWQQVLATNLTGPMVLCQALVPLMMDRRGGAIVNISSNSAHIPGNGQVSYAASKGGLEALTRALAVELRRLGIRVNAVRVGRVRTQLTEAAATTLAAADSAPWGEPDDIADVVAFLASDAARYLTGQVITADGGLAVTRRGTR